MSIVSEMELQVVRHQEAKRGFVLLPRRWVVERTFARLGRIRRLARDYERLARPCEAHSRAHRLSLLLRTGTLKGIPESSLRL